MGASLASLGVVGLATLSAAVVRSAGHDRWDLRAQHQVMSLQGRWVSDVSQGAADLAAPVDLLVVALLAIVLLWRGAHRPLVAAAVLVVPLLTAALVQVLAVAFEGVRPAFQGLLGLPVPQGSFPSAATADAAALWGMLALAGVLLVRRPGVRAVCGTAGLLLTAALAWAQVYRRHAWPSDVLAGWLLAGAAVGVATVLLAAWPAPLPVPLLPEPQDSPKDRRGGRGRRTLAP